jgi:integrase
MPKLVHKRPAYSHHKPSNRGRVFIAGKYYYRPGEYESAESREAYWALIRRAENGELPDPQDQDSKRDNGATKPNVLTNAELIERYWVHVQEYYRRDGKSTGEAGAIHYALKPLLELCPATLVAEFKPSDLKAVRQEMFARGWSRRYINASVRRVKAAFSWAVEAELLSPEVAGAVRIVKALQAGRSAAREKEDVGPVEDAVVDATLPHLRPLYCDIIELMRRSGCRPGEWGKITVEAIDRSDAACWTCELENPKTRWRGKRRTLLFGPRCQAILMRWIVKVGGGPVFPVTYAALRTAIRRACKRHGIPLWTQNQLRHAAATEARRVGGLESAQALLGHAHARTTETYAEVDATRGRQVVRIIG